MMNPFRRKLAYAQCAILLFAMPWYKSAYTEQQVAEGGFPEWAAWLFAAIVLCYAIQIFCIWTWAPNDAPIVGLHYGGSVALNLLFPRSPWRMLLPWAAI